MRETGNGSGLTDSHAHIYGSEFAGDFTAMMERAEHAGVRRIIVPGADLESSRQAAALAAADHRVWAAVGVHPHDAAGVDESVYRAIQELASGPRVVAIGEIGLDFFRDRSPRDVQEEVFRRFIRLAKSLDLPVIVHDRDAHERVMAILKEEGAADCGGVLHCFSGDLEMARECVELGFYVSIPGTVTYPSNEQLREVVRGIRIGGIGGGWDSPAADLYPRLARDLDGRGIRSLHIRFRNPLRFDDCVHDVLAGLSHLQAGGAERLGLVGHSLGGGVAIRAALVEPRVRTVVAISPQTFGAEGIETLGSRCSLLFLHGGGDRVLPPECSRYLHDRATGEKRLVIHTDSGHLLESAAAAVTEEVRNWLLDHLAPG